MMFDWNTAFGDVPHGFEARVRQTVERMQAQPTSTVMKNSQAARAMQKPKLRLTFALTALLLLLLGTALALSSLGVLDTLNENLRMFLLPSATELVQTEVSQQATQTRYATFTAEQAVSDGHQIYVTVRVHADDGVLLMDEDAEPSWCVEHWRGYQDEYQDGAVTFSGKAHETGRLLVQASCEPVNAQGERLNVGIPEIAYDGEDILYTVTYPADVEGTTLTLHTYDVYSEGVSDEPLSIGTLTPNVRVTEARSFYTADLPALSPDGKIALSGLTVEQTPIATYVTYKYGAADPQDVQTILNLRSGVWPEWLDENGTAYDEGESGNSVDTDEEGNTRYTAIYRAFEQMPSGMTVRFQHVRNEEPLTVTLHPMDTKEVNP